MKFDKRTEILSQLQRLTSSQSELIYRLSELGLLDGNQFESLINEMTKMRFEKGRAYINFADKLNENSSEDQVHIISRNYYAIYHIARSVVFHNQRKDIDSHTNLPEVFSRVVGLNYGDKLEKWRDIRNTIE